ncbi:adenylate/guanylate cyclase domain-containing protein [Azospirillum sp. B21]|uniref:adenylate/guanylate cyclase domain-containing protein n=1 Tax=Azospirillum sp. B21 TaxID=2607496 RepID=UPI0011ED8B8F|nr:adenylate/guanylate cyclase domain-containing protein [Azospirillum sp. B21]KAA0579641.1 adenylate/guanylate cyclase domain-containing protein [Azospirillum sp. B21]
MMTLDGRSYEIPEVAQVAVELRGCIGEKDLDRALVSAFINIPGICAFACLGKDIDDALVIAPHIKDSDAVAEKMIHRLTMKAKTWSLKQNDHIYELDDGIFYHQDADCPQDEEKFEDFRILFIARLLSQGKNYRQEMRCALLVEKDSYFCDQSNFRSDSALFVIAMMLDEAVRRRRAALQAFPPVLSAFYLRQAHTRRNKGIALDPPWLRHDKGGDGIDTITISLDLRKSTQMMEKAVQPEYFAKWLSAMVQVLRSIVHRHLGVFDKFTGDGILAHFLVRDIRALSGEMPRSGVLAAVSCADEMIEATSILLHAVQPFIRFDSGLFGAGVGIARDWAHWENDRDNQLIVVGTGVVDACRMSSGAKAGRILMTVNTFHNFMDDGGCPGLKCRPKNFIAKGYPEDHQYRVWVLSRTHPLSTESSNWIEQTCTNALSLAYNEDGAEAPCSGALAAVRRMRSAVARDVAFPAP